MHPGEAATAALATPAPPGSPGLEADGTAPPAWWRQGRTWGVAALVAACLALVARFAVAGGSSLTYNEATYVEMAAHPWWSSYYPDSVFLRHPPLAFVALWAWRGLVGTDEAAIRLLALAFVLCGVAFTWDAARRVAGWTGAVLAGVALGGAFLLHTYALEATMYPMAFMLGGAAVWARTRGSVRGEGVALALLALTHLFGFLFLGLWALVRRRQWRSSLRLTWPAWAWLALSVPVAYLANPLGDVMRLGPLGQLVRSNTTVTEAATESTWVHVASAALAAWCLGPVLLRAAWRDWRRYPEWAIAAALLCAYFLVGAPFPRYAILPLPFVLVAGAAALHAQAPKAGSPARRHGVMALAAAMAVLSLPIGAAYLTEGPDPRAAGDVPGLQDWEAAAEAAEATGAQRIATTNPTSTAYYLGGLGYEVTDRKEAPYSIPMDGPRGVEVLRMASEEDADTDADAWIVPSHWEGDGLRRILNERHGQPCAEVEGLVVYAVRCA